MKLRLALEEKMMDSRLRDRLVAVGKITKKEVDQYLADLAEEPESAYERVSDEDRNPE